jgi:hypothetical protein
VRQHGGVRDEVMKSNYPCKHGASTPCSPCSAYLLAWGKALTVEIERWAVQHRDLVSAVQLTLLQVCEDAIHVRAEGVGQVDHPQKVPNHGLIHLCEHLPLLCA